ncbi:sulfotransferase family protein [Salininema proteolyticum]|uniref:Sulfotransferase family protein n=1 Tax=Salininema proteolyticum TaxID=1607685 RepID=A0ABV8U215_9ACTN
MLHVIGAGLPRTGTLTLKNALEKLLDAPCHHMIEVAHNLERDVPRFTAAAAGEPTDWNEVYKGYRAAVDWPTSAFWKELIEAYPDAPVVLSFRDSPEQWATSMLNTVLKGFDDPPEEMVESGWHDMVEAVWQKAAGGTDRSDKAALEAFYSRHLEEVRSTVPEGRLLEFNPREGWEPLCGFLQVPVPDEPFPHVNSTKEFQERVARVQAGEDPADL